MSGALKEKGKNKSYVIRAGRMSALKKHALEEYLPIYGIPFAKGITDLQEYFPQRAPIILEIGFGMGAATIELAERYRMYNFIGIEVHPPGVGKLLDEIHRRSLDNIRVIYHDAVSVIKEMIPDESLMGIHIFFPDPWPKKRHHKRRLIQREFAESMAEKLKAGGYLYVTTDWEDYAWHIVYTLGGVNKLENAHEVFAPSIPWRPITSFERKGIEQKHLVREILFTKEGKSGTIDNNHTMEECYGREQLDKPD